MIWHQALIGRGQNIFPYQQERKSNQKYHHTTGIYEQGGTHQQEQTTYRNIGAAASKTTIHLKSTVYEPRVEQLSLAIPSSRGTFISFFRTPRAVALSLTLKDRLPLHRRESNHIIFYR